MGSSRENVGGVEAPHISISVAPLWKCPKSKYRTEYRALRPSSYCTFPLPIKITMLICRAATHGAASGCMRWIFLCNILPQSYSMNQATQEWQ